MSGEQPRDKRVADICHPLLQSTCVWLPPGTRLAGDLASDPGHMRGGRIDLGMRLGGDLASDPGHMRGRRIDLGVRLGGDLASDPSHMTWV